MTGYESKKKAAQGKLDSMEREALKLALEALLNSVDLVVEDAYNAEQLYGSYPTRQARIGGLKVLADKHREAITAAEAALAQPAQEPNFGPQPDMHYGMNQDDWKDVVAAISKVRDSRGIYLACRPADVFQDWFLAMGLFKPKENNT